MKHQEEYLIVVRNWQKFQHYKDRRPSWVKNYTELLADHNYLKLTLRERGILHGIWVAYAASRQELGANPAQLGRILGSTSVRTRDLKRLERLGFIELLLASRAHAREAYKAKDLKNAYEEPLEAFASAVHDDGEPFDFEQIEYTPRDLP